MRKLFNVVLLLGLSVGTSAAEINTLTQYSTLGALFQQMYDGDMTLGRLRPYGNFGLGTVNGLDGELIVLDDMFYQVRADGSVHVLPPETRTPFAVVTTFAPDQRQQTPGSIDYAGFREHVDRSIPSENFFYAIKVEGLFVQVKARSVQAQTKPYPPLAEIVKRQSVFEFKNTRGMLIGFRIPTYAGNLNVAGFHLHFLTADQKSGGHVLDFIIEDGTIEIDQLSRLLLILPETGTFQRLDLVPTEPASVRQVEGPH